MIVFRFVLLALAKLLLLVTVPVASIVIPLYTREEVPELDKYTWGGWWGTFDNPPQGDRGFVSKRAPFKDTTTGVKGYINRVVWMFRNPLYGFMKESSVEYKPSYQLVVKGNPDISDKYGVPGWLLARLYNSSGKLKAFEWYSVTPWSEGRCLRVRMGWKIKTEKMQERGWARLVVTFNPLDGYNNN